MATLLPNGEQTFFDANGVPLALGSVAFYIPGTSTPKNTWQDAAQVTLNTNPVPLDAAGRAIIYGVGGYRTVLKDVLGNTIWDVVTDEPASALDVQNNVLTWGGTSGGGANAQTLTFAGLIPSVYQAGQRYQFKAGFTNSGACTLNVNGLGAKNVYKTSGSGPVVLTGAEITTNNIVDVIYDGTQFQIA
jgi:hypothetical protein